MHKYFITWVDNTTHKFYNETLEANNISELIDEFYNDLYGHIEINEVIVNIIKLDE